MLAFLKGSREWLEPTVIAPATGRLAEALAARGIDHLPWWGGEEGQATLASGLRERRVELVHANSLMTADRARRLGKRLGLPAIAHVRDIMRLSDGRKGRLAKLDAIIAVSKAVASDLIAQGLPGDLVKTIHNGVDGASLRSQVVPGRFRAELGLPPESRLLGCIGQVALRKGQDLFLEMAESLADRDGTIHFVLAGARYSSKEESRQFEEGLHEKATGSRLRGRVHFVGYRTDVPSILNDLDLLVIPSRQEPLSRVLLEGLALGVPVVATNVGGMEELLDHGRTGLLVAPDDAATLAEAAWELLRDEPRRRELRPMGPRWVSERFSVERQTQAIRSLYEDVLGR
ncbi:glycosyltransferase family 4 protein [Kolteria novifilia]